MQATTVRQPTGWQAGIELGFETRAGCTVLNHRARFGPLAVQRPFYPEGDLCHVYLLHPPGGVAGGDRLSIEVEVAAEAHALITTPGAGKFYRSAGPGASQSQRLNVASGASLEWLPQENILFPGARTEIATHISLDEDARFIGWELNCLGLPVNGQRFDRGQATFRTHIERRGNPLLIERLDLTEGSDLDGPAGLRSHPVLGSLFATCDDPDAQARCREAMADFPGEAGLTWMDGLLVVRLLADSTSTANALFVKLWDILRPATLGRDAVPPRIWQT